MTSIPDHPGLTAVEAAALIGAGLSGAGTVTAGAIELARATRELIEAVVMTDVDGAARGVAGAEVAAIAERLRAMRRPGAVLLVRHDDGRIEHLTQAGSGRLNPQAPEIVFEPFELAPAGPVPVELVAHCTLTASHGGPPGRTHGGPVATLLDEVVGVAAFAAGAPGVTATLTVHYRRPTPHGEPLEIRARLDRWDVRKRWVSGEIMAGGEVTASAEALLIGPRGTAADAGG